MWADRKAAKEALEKVHEDIETFAKAEGLTEAEKKEQTELRNEYRHAVVGNLNVQLENTYIVTPDGKKRKVGSGSKR